VTAWPLERIERWFLWTGLFLLPLAYSWDTYDHYVLPKLMVARVLVLGLLILYVARAISARGVVYERTPLDLPWLAFLASAALSTLVAENRNTAVFGTYSRYDGLLTILLYAATFWLSVQTLAARGMRAHCCASCSRADMWLHCLRSFRPSAIPQLMERSHRPLAPWVRRTRWGLSCPSVATRLLRIGRGQNHPYWPGWDIAREVWGS
jgi:hypothetical protein